MPFLNQILMNSLIDTSLLDGMIIGRTEPQIYAFTTETIPNYLKVGDTYRPVGVRLSEWERIFPRLKHQYTHTAMLASGRIFRDYAVHQFLEKDKGLHRLMPSDIPQGVYYSREFFKEASPQDIDEAIADIQRSEENADGRYGLYTSTHLPVRLAYKRDQTFKPRANQQEAIDRFKNAVAHGRTNLLMYAVMRFGKSFTAMCCATEAKARLVVIVSAKADVRGEWKKTVESHVRFSDYVFLQGEDLARDKHIVSQTLREGKRAALFLTLQDLQGTAIKGKHAEVFGTDIDLLIVDETHFGARAEKYGAVLREQCFDSKLVGQEIQGADTSDGMEKEIKILQAKVRLHLSGTPYRILMGREFEGEDIVAFCQYTDIAAAKDKWDKENGTKDGVNEWDNPYYGFPQMIRFAFCPNASSMKRMEQLKREGVTYAFSALFKPMSLTKDVKGLHRQFIYEREILELFEIIDGSRSDQNLLGFLDYDRIKEGKMCRHIVCVLPFRASCDALEALLKSHQPQFKNLSSYAVINIAGLDDENKFRNTEDVKHAVKECERNGQKTLTLTVNRMMTGSTVEEWDTMLYFKDTASPQEYDQATFRIQNQYIKTYVDAEGNNVRYNMKPQTLLVDFDPGRMFRMQEQKAEIYNVNTDRKGNEKLTERLRRELEVSPIVSLNHGLLQRITPSNIMDAVREYGKGRGAIEELNDIPKDHVAAQDLEMQAILWKLPEVDSHGGIIIQPNEGEEQDLITPSPNNNTHGPSPSNASMPSEDKDSVKWEKKLDTLYLYILLYTFLTEAPVQNLEEVISSISKGEGNNLHVAKVLGLTTASLQLLHSKLNPFILSKLDYKISNINTLKSDVSMPPLERAVQALRKLARVSDSEVVTPPLIANELVDMMPKEAVAAATPILDIASVQGEVACAIYKKFGKEAACHVYAVPTSELTRELTKKIYGLMELPAEHVLHVYASNLLDASKKDEVDAALPKDASLVIGVPMLGKKRGGGRNDGREALYQHYYFFAKERLSAKYIILMTQSTWYSGGRGERLDEFREEMLNCGHVKELHDYPDIEKYTKSNATTLRGGVCMFLWQEDYKGDTLVVNKFCGKEYAQMRPMRYGRGEFKSDFFIRWNKGLEILEKVLAKETSFIPDGGLMSHRNPFGFPDTKDNFASRRSKNKRIKVYLAKGKVGYTDRVANNPDDLLNQWKVLVAKASSGNDTLPHRVISSPFVAEPGSVTANTHYVIRPCKGKPTEQQAKNLAAYMRTRFFRFMVMLLRSNQNMRTDMYQFAPRLDFNETWTDEKLYARYGITNEEREYIESIIMDFDGRR